MPALSDIINRFTTYVINPAILVIFAAGFFLFIWGLVQFLWYSREGRPDEEGKWHMIYGLVGMLVMVSVWGIIGIINDTFSLGISPGSSTYTPDTSRINNITNINFGGSQ